jgi:hypothetical protein
VAAGTYYEAQALTGSRYYYQTQFAGITPKTVIKT